MGTTGRIHRGTRSFCSACVFHVAVLLPYMDFEVASAGLDCLVLLRTGRRNLFIPYMRDTARALRTAAYEGNQGRVIAVRFFATLAVYQ